MFSSELTQDDLGSLNLLIGEKCNIQVGRIGKLYKSSGTHFVPIATGIFTGEKDGKRKSYFIRFYNLKRKKMEFEQEVFCEMEYTLAHERFHICQGTSFPFGLSFLKREDAVIFQEYIRKTIDFGRKKNSSSAVMPPAPSQGPTTMTPNVSMRSIPQTIKSKGGKGKRITAADIGAPINFHHIEHVDLDPKKNFYRLDSPETRELQETLREMGFGDVINSDSDAAVALKFLQKHGGIEALRQNGTSAISGPMPVQRPAPTPSRPTPSPGKANQPRTNFVPPPPQAPTSIPAAPVAPAPPPPPPMIGSSTPRLPPTTGTPTLKPSQPVAPKPSLPSAPPSLQDQIQSFNKSKLNKTVAGSGVDKPLPEGAGKPGLGLANALVNELNRRRDIMDNDTVDSNSDADDWDED